MRIPSSHALALSAVLALGAGLRIAAVTAPGSLQWDELATARNAVQSDWTDLLLLRPLDQLQVAPIGFMLAEKAGSSLLGKSDLGLRLFPLLVSLASLLLFWRIAARYLSGWSLIAAIGLFAVCPALVWYARKVKQYAGDVATVLFLWLLALQFMEGRWKGRRGWIPGILGGVAILLSQPAAIVGFGICVVLFVQQWRTKARLDSVVRLWAGWLAGSVALGASSLRLAPPTTREFMHSGWEGAFFPAPWAGPEAWLWLPRHLFRFMGFFFGMLRPDTPIEIAFVLVYCILAALGFYHLARGWKPEAALLLVPLLAAIAASVLRVLPFSGRLIIYIGPSLLIACIMGLDRVVTALGPRFRRPGRAVAAGVALAPGLLVPLLILALVRHEDTRPVLEEMKAHWRQGDALYVYRGAVPAMAFYGEQLGLGPWVEGGDHTQQQRRYLEEIDAFRGRERVWFFYTHRASCEPDFMLDYMDAIGTLEKRIEDPHEVVGFHQTEGYLYDLSEGIPREAVSAATYTVPEEILKKCGRPAPPVGEGIKRRVKAFLSGLRSPGSDPGAS